jgi:hypothetical protein
LAGRIRLWAKTVRQVSGIAVLSACGMFGYDCAMLVVVGLIIAFVLIAVFSNRDTRYCPWRERRGRDGSQWACIHCGATVAGEQGKPPLRCLRS